MHLKNDFINIAISSSTRVTQIPQNCRNIYEKWKKKGIGKLDHTETDQKGATYA